MHKDDVVAATKRKVASTFDCRDYKGKGKRSRRNGHVEQEHNGHVGQEQNDGVSVHTLGHQRSDSPMTRIRASITSK